MKKYLFVSVLILAVVFSSFGISHSQTPPTMSMQGYVESIDWVGSLLVLKKGYSNNFIRFKVASNAKAYRGTDDISLSDIEVNDPVNVKYYKDKDGTLVITEIQDSNMANAF